MKIFKKIIAVLAVVVTFFGYWFYSKTQEKTITNPNKNETTSKPMSTVSVTNTPITSTKNKIVYRDGSYTGKVADAFYGNIQVQAIIRNGQLADVVFLQYPNDRDNSIRINNMAMPELKSEAISSQAADVSTVSGASASSGAFRQSLQSALDQAKI